MFSRVRLAGAIAFVAIAPLSMAANRPVRRVRPAATGRIEGAVLLSNSVTARRPRFRIYSDPGPGAKPPAHDNDEMRSAEMRNVVIYVQNVPWQPEGELHASMPQDDEQFMPH